MTIEIVFPQSEEERQNNKRNFEYIRNNLIRPGSTVTPKTFIYFSDGTSHIPGHSYHVTEESINYYVVNFSSYIVKEY